MLASHWRRLRRVFRPPRGSWSYRYQLFAGLPDTGPVSAIPVLVLFDQHATNHAYFEGAPEPHPLRGVDDETRADVLQEVADGE